MQVIILIKSIALLLFLIALILYFVKKATQFDELIREKKVYIPSISYFVDAFM